MNPKEILRLKATLKKFAPKILDSEMRSYSKPLKFENILDAKRRLYKVMCDEHRLPKREAMEKEVIFIKPNCNNCKYWDKMPYKNGGFGVCKSDKWNVSPNYYTESERVTELDMVEVTYNPITGGNFGCIHFKLT